MDMRQDLNGRVGRHRILILGGSYAGLTAMSRLARLGPKALVWTGRKAAMRKDICRTTPATIGVWSIPAPPLVPPLEMLPPLMRSRRQYA